MESNIIGEGAHTQYAYTKQDGKMKEREQWANKLEFILSVIGGVVGLGNIWRFPYLCYKNGGGAFMIPYIIFIFTCGIPVFVLEVVLGQYTSQSGIMAWRMVCPLFEGIGYGSQIILSYLDVYYILILAWSFFYLFSCFNAELPWASCSHEWNTADCVEFTKNSSANNWTRATNGTSAIIEFWENHVLKLSDGINHLGTVQWKLVLCLLLSWIICFFCIWKGVKSTGKVVYFTATFPYVMLIILLIRGLTLPGAAEGIKFYMYPDLSRLSDPQVWMDAGTQIFFSYAVCLGALTSLGSYNKYHNNCYRDCLFLSALNSGTSLVSGIAVFSVLGFMSYEQGIPISEVAESGPGLVFIAYPKAITMMPFSQLWAFLFFLMIILLGLDSQFVGVECLATSIMDLFPTKFQGKNHREFFILAIAMVSFSFGLLLVTEGGMYILQLLDYYAVSGTCLLFLSTFEVLCIGWVYGADRFYDNIEDMIGYRPWPIMKWCWCFITPGVCLGTFIFSLIEYTPLKYNNSYVYPTWAYILGWLLALSSMVCIPLWMLFKFLTTKGSFKQRIFQLIQPSDDLKQFGTYKIESLLSSTSDASFRYPSPGDKNSHIVPPDKETVV